MTDGSEGGPRRVRRSKAKEDFIERLRTPPGGAFAEIRDVLVFAGAVGYAEGRFEPLTDPSPNAIRWDTWINRWFAEELIQLIAVAHSDDKAVASADRISEQIVIFEGYANGGLSYLAERHDRLRTEDPLDVILELLDTRSGKHRGVDALISLAETADFS